MNYKRGSDRTGSQSWSAVDEEIVPPSRALASEAAEDKAFHPSGKFDQSEIAAAADDLRSAVRRLRAMGIAEIDGVTIR